MVAAWRDDDGRTNSLRYIINIYICFDDDDNVCLVARARGYTTNTEATCFNELILTRVHNVTYIAYTSNVHLCGSGCCTVCGAAFDCYNATTVDLWNECNKIYVICSTNNLCREKKKERMFVFCIFLFTMSYLENVIYILRFI